jgi:DNA-binding MarR family transcriptional regulator
MTNAQAEEQWELGKLLHDLDMQCNARMRDWVTPLGLTVAQASALREMTGPMTMKELAHKMSCEPSNATIVIDKLETLKLIERRPHPTDRRAKQLVLTDEGTALRGKVVEAVSREPVFPGLGPEQLKALEGLLRQSLAAGGA